MIVSMCQHCDEQQFRNTVMCRCAPYTIFSVVKLDLCIRAQSVTRSHSTLKKPTRTPPVRLAYILFYLLACSVVFDYYCNKFEVYWSYLPPTYDIKSVESIYCQPWSIM